MRKVIVSLLLAAGTVAAVATQASPMHGPGGPGGHPLMAAIEQLDLSDSQRSQVRKILMSHRDQAKAEHEKVHAQLVRFSELDPDSPRYAGDVAAIADQASAGARAHLAQAAAVQKEVYAVLTAEQRSKLPQLVADADPKRLPGMADARIMALFDDLDLSDEQWLAVHKIQKSHRDEAVADAQKMQQQMASFLSLDPTAKDYAARLAVVSDTFAAGAAAHVQKIAAVQKQVYAVLTPDQRQKFAAQLREMDFRGPRHG